MHSRQFLLLTLLASTSPALAQFFSTQVDEPLPEATFTTTSVSGAEQTTTELPPATFITSPEPSESSTESGSGFSTDLDSDDDSETSTSTDSVATLTIPEGFITESPTGSTTYILPTETSTVSSDDDDESEDQDQNDDDDDTPSTTTSNPTTLSTTTNIEDLLTDTASPTPTGGAGALAMDPVVLFACVALGFAGFEAAF
ncbi:hypothetical protein BJX62DRAFT_207633 [Aspergillus germanicus]